MKRAITRGAATLLCGTMMSPAMAQTAAPTPRIGTTFEQSVEYPVGEAPARAGAPNVLIWMIDDVGFGQLGSYGGLIETPNIDRAAAMGLRYTNYHTTPICSASRASLLTGRNSHTVHIGGHSAMAIGFPGQDARIPREAGTIADNLGAAGYATYAIGKWDHLPPAHASAPGPFTYWPSGQGFDRFYGFLSFDADNFSPVLWSDHEPLALPKQPDYHLSADMADRAIGWIGSRDATAQRPPFFLYWATGAMHSPHHAPQSWLDHYRGRFDEGWDVARQRILARQKKLGIISAGTTLPLRPEGMPAWKELNPNQRKLYARAMEAAAAQLSHADAQFGRILDELERRGELANTIVMIMTDNGASAEGAPEGTYSEHYMANGRFATTEQNMKYLDVWGGANTYPLYPMGWAAVGNTPFRYYKQTAYEGGTHVPLIVSWPKGIAARGGLRGQYHHVSDILPTILDAAKIQPAKKVDGVQQMPFDGASLAYSFDDAKAPTTKTVQYYEMYGNRALWAGGWKAVMPHRLKTWDFKTQPPITETGWQLYDLTRDINEQRDLAASQPGKLKALIAQFDAEARRYNVYPLTNTGAAQRSMAVKAEAAVVARKGRWHYDGPIARGLSRCFQWHDSSDERGRHRKIVAHQYA